MINDFGFLQYFPSFHKSAKSSAKIVTIIIWGASTGLVGEDAEVQKELIKLMKNGITVEACKACADKMKVSDTLKEIGIEVRYMSKLTQYIKGDDHLITI